MVWDKYQTNSDFVHCKGFAMKFGVSVSNYGKIEDPRDFIRLAKGVEDAGWDGFFLWDHINWRGSFTNHDPWVLLSAIAAETERVKIGPLVTPLPRRRPHKVAREALTLDHLSKGRFILGVGLGWPPKNEYGAFKEPTDIKIRAKMLDEALEIVTGLWSGEQFSFKGDHYELDNVAYQPTPYNKKGIPIWVGGTWPKKGPFRRAARYNGVVPQGTGTGTKFRDMMTYVKKHRTNSEHYDWVCSTAYVSRNKRDAFVNEFQGVGATWYIESWGTESYEKQTNRVKRGPPVIP
jgi:alkanesulfonate monooxygenase SsuD/methylene tetrahydromethanopterin reductase-like flavin-dependent oxidoreductase (luciferase family)